MPGQPPPQGVRGSDDPGRSPVGSGVTQLLEAISRDTPGAADDLLPIVYDTLRSMAHRQMQNEPAGHTLQPTALVHEAYLRLVGDGDAPPVSWQNRAHFFGAAARAMRRILVERARRKDAQKHGGGLGFEPVTDDTPVPLPVKDELDLLALDRALDRLAAHDERWSQIVMLRFFAGLSIDDTAACLELSPTTVKDEWAFARAWLHRALEPDSPGRAGGASGAR